MVIKIHSTPSRPTVPGEPPGSSGPAPETALMALAVVCCLAVFAAVLLAAGAAGSLAGRLAFGGLVIVAALAGWRIARGLLDRREP